MAKQKMNTETLVKKLKSVSNTQDSIPMLSLWIIHHKSHHKLIVDQWLQVLKHSKSPHRLTLLYLCNDVIQNCHRKNADIFKDSFCDVLPEAITLLRDVVIRSNVERVVKIWSKRKVLDSEITDQLIAALLTNKPPQKLRNKLLVEYKTAHLINEIQKFKDLEDEIEAEQQRLRAMRVDVSNYDAIRKLKDKIGGEKFSKDFEESAAQLEVFLKRYDKFLDRRKQLLELLDQGSVYYHAQYHEAKIVVNAYKNFEGRVNKMKRGLDKVKSNLPSNHASPHIINDSMQVDDMQEDMEMSDDDKELGNKPSKIVAVNTSLLKPIQKSVPEKSSSTDNVLKLLASGLESIKPSNPDVGKDNLKKGGGVISRPGMRGATTSKTSVSSAKSDVNLGSLTITRSVEQADFDVSRPGLQNDIDVTLGSESPPSPTGSPELNISSPPRHQSLDSRLADLFSNATPGDVEKPVSDSESDVGDVVKETEVKSEEHPTPSSSLLPGLGDLNQISTLIPAFSDAGAPKVDETPVTIPDITAISSAEKSRSQAIPVIGGAFRPSASSVPDGSSTPTLDENPFHSATSVTNDPNYPGGQSFLSPPRFSGDALSFLSKFMGQATNTELPKADDPSPGEKNSTLNHDVKSEQTWQPVPTPHSKEAIDINSNKQPWNAHLPSPPKPTVPVPPSWESIAVNRTSSFPSVVKVEDGNKPPVKHEFPGDMTEELPTKKGRWEVDRDNAEYRKGTESYPGPVEGRRNSNLITLSEQTGESKKPPTSTEPSTSTYEPMTHFREMLRRRSEEQPQPTFIEKTMPPKELAEKPKESESDDNIMHVSSHAVIVGNKGNLKDFEEAALYSSAAMPASSVYVASDSQEESYDGEENPYMNPHFSHPPAPHEQNYNYTEGGHDNGFNPPMIRNPPPRRFPPPHLHPRDGPPMRPPPVHRRSFVDEERLDYELGRFEERQREVAMMESMHHQERHPMRLPRHPMRPPPRVRLRHLMSHPRPRFLGGPRPPRMRYY